MQNSNAGAGRICPRGATYYIWQSGDTLESVARQNQTTAQAITVLNPTLNFNTLAAGTEICMPSQVYTCITGQPYTVQAGDTFQSIAAALGITTYELQERNPDVAENNLIAGQILCIPRQDEQDGGTVTPPPTTGGSGSGTGSGTGSGGVVVIPQPGISCPVGYEAKRIQAGQTYVDLLIDNNVSYRAMRATNPFLHPGALIAGTPYCAPPAGTRQTCARGAGYVIQPDETLTSLAAKFNTTRARLLMLNPTLLPSDFSSGTVICTP